MVWYVDYDKKVCCQIYMKWLQRTFSKGGFPIDTWLNYKVPTTPIPLYNLHFSSDGLTIRDDGKIKLVIFLIYINRESHHINVYNTLKLGENHIKKSLCYVIWLAVCNTPIIVVIIPGSSGQPIHKRSNMYFDHLTLDMKTPISVNVFILDIHLSHKYELW